jgi:Ca-activated chloride channel family protein
MIGLLAFPAADAVAVAKRSAHRPMGEAVIIGSVKSEAGAAIGGATLSIEGTRTGTLSKDDGRYRLIVESAGVPRDSSTLIVRIIGFEEQKRRVFLRPGHTDTANFTLKAKPLKLGQVVVTGAGIESSKGDPGSAGGMTVRGLRPMGTPSVSSTVDAATVAPNMPASAGYGGGNQLMAMKSAYAVDEELKEADQVIVMERSAPLVDGKIKRSNVPQYTRAPNPQAPLPPVTQGTLRARLPDGEIAGEFPLKHTEVNAEISGYLARTMITQQYTNPFKEVIEAVYIFPLPSMAAVNDFMMEVGGRKIVGIVRPRAEAERIYREAMARGQTASLLTQERPNIFTQSVANIEPGGYVDIKITYFERLNYEHGEYEWVLPMVVGPRYIPGGGQGNAHLAGNGIHPVNPDGGGWSPNTTIVPDASRITPPVLKPGQRSGHDIGVTVTLDAGLPITKLTVPAHHVEISRPGGAQRVIRLAAGDSIPNRDFIVRWSVAGDETQFGVITHRNLADGAGFLTLAMQPPAEPSDEQVTPREITFIMDVSGSMMGIPIEMSRQVVLRSLDKLRPDDRFNIVYFASGNAQLWESAQLGSYENISAAKEFLKKLNAGGGTEMLAGVQRALHARHDARYLQMYVFLTDGYVGDEPRILETIKKERGDARFFGFGIGSSVNRYLIDGIGQEGGGESFVLIPRDSAYANRGVSMLFDAIDSPVLVDVAVDWNGLPVEDVYPSKLPDLFGGQTINLIAKYTNPAKGTFYVTGRIGSRRVRYPVRVTLPEREPAHEALAPTWARAKIADLSSQQLAADSSEKGDYERRITDVAMHYHLVSQYTAFVAVDESRIVGNGQPRRIMQPVELPEGVSYQGIFGEPCVGEPVRIGAWGIDLQETQSGKLRVGAVTASGAAGQAGITKGAVVKSVNGVAVSDVATLERVLMQSGTTVTVIIGSGEKVTLKAP